MENQRLQATVERVVFFNPENGWAVARLRAAGERDLITVVGRLSEVHPGEVLSLEGHWTDDPRHGPQFQATTVQVRRPADVNGLMLYLGSGVVPGLGRVLARRIVEHFGEQALPILDEDPARVIEVPGIGAARARSLSDAWAHQREVRGVMEWLRERGVSTLYASRILQAYGDEAMSVLTANPYRLALELPGFGFVAADQLGKAVGVPLENPLRVQAGVEWCLHRAADDGDCFLPYGELCTRAVQATKVRPEAVRAAAGQLVSAGRVFGAVAPLPKVEKEEVTVGNRRLTVYAPAYAPTTPDTPIYLSAFEYAEAGIARCLRVMGMVARPVDAERVSRWVQRYEAAIGMELAPEQREALSLGAASGVLVLTGGPGTGKTTALRALYRLLRAMGHSVALAAPTGKATRRLAEVTNASACTVHRLLGAGRGQESTFNEDNPLPFDVVVVDESSMLDVFLMYRLVRAMRSGAQMVLVGDADQLPSVGPGQVLRDILAAETVPAIRLNRIFRQAAMSRIVTAAHEVRQGLVPDIPPPDDHVSDLWLVAAPRGQVGAAVVHWATEQLPSRLGVTPADVQVLSPQLRGEAGTDSLNSRLQARLNPAHAGRVEWFRGALPLRERDRVIHTANNYRLGVFNGETGQVTRINITDQIVTVDFGDRTVDYSPAELIELQHAYALTVHRAQGSEWPAVVVALSSEHTRMLGRNLLYTAMTRARRGVVLVGEREVLAGAVANESAMARRTGLTRRLREGIAR